MSFKSSNATHLKYYFPYDMNIYLKNWRRRLNACAAKEKLNPCRWKNKSRSEKSNRVLMIVVAVVVASFCVIAYVVNQGVLDDDATKSTILALLAIAPILLLCCCIGVCKNDSPLDYRKYGHDDKVLDWLESYSKEHSVNALGNLVEMKKHLRDYYRNTSERRTSIVGSILSIACSTFVAFIISLLIATCSMAQYSFHIMMLAICFSALIGMCVFLLTRAIAFSSTEYYTTKTAMELYMFLDYIESYKPDLLKEIDASSVSLHN